MPPYIGLFRACCLNADALRDFMLFDGLTYDSAIPHLESEAALLPPSHNEQHAVLTPCRRRSICGIMAARHGSLSATGQSWPSWQSFGAIHRKLGDYRRGRRRVR